MKNFEPVDNPDLKHLQLFIYLIPIIGFFPALWTLYRDGKQPTESSDPMKPHQDSREQLTVSRLSVTLAGSWLLGYLLLGTGAEMSEFLTLRLLLLNTLLTSGYFLVTFWLMVRLWQRKSPRLPGFSSFAERVVGKYLS